MSNNPPGHISESEVAAADAIAAYLHATYNVSIVRDWGLVTSFHFQPAFPFITMGRRWKPGRWTLVELQTVQEALADLSAFMGGAERFKALVRRTKVALSPRTRGRGLTMWGGRRVEFRDSGKPPTTVDIQNKHNIDKWTVVHEFGHVWDASHGWRLSVGLEAHTGGSTGGSRPQQCDEHNRLPGCNKALYHYGGTPPRGSDVNFNRREDFAECVVASVYPAAAQADVARFKQDRLYKDCLYYADFTTTPRWDYIQSLLH